ncbi:hypothetical protein CDAR_254891 [Caerostris darwini]|uniref:Uncharacterized protein n=1 Tax=Caerostris darwini TaxID=1538125 RepID=A0AAV4VCV8_9ARAC|nr:hypothetical protein CDAR_254891 [Caerostris darwini]
MSRGNPVLKIVLSATQEFPRDEKHDFWLPLERSQKQLNFEVFTLIQRASGHSRKIPAAGRKSAIHISSEIFVSDVTSSWKAFISHPRAILEKPTEL